MPSYKLIVMTQPVEGREQEYNDWYQGMHLADLVAVYGVKSAQRFRLSRTVVADRGPLPDLAISEIETDDIDKTLDDLKARVEAGRYLCRRRSRRKTTSERFTRSLGPVVARIGAGSGF